MVEMTETSHILRGASPHSLVLLDEIGRGTSTWDGLSIAWSVAEYLHDVVGCRALFATHYHELTRIAESKTGIHNVYVVVKEQNDQIVFVRTLADGAAGRSYGIQVARLAGLPPAVLARAKELLANLESHGRDLLVPSTTTSPQMTLFSQRIPADSLRERLRSLDILRMTPLEAMQQLASLIQEAHETENKLKT